MSYDVVYSMLLVVSRLASLMWIMYNSVIQSTEIIMNDLIMCSDCGCTMPSSEAEYLDVGGDPICTDCFDEVYPSSYERLDNFDPAGH